MPYCKNTLVKTYAPIHFVPLVQIRPCLLWQLFCRHQVCCYPPELPSQILTGRCRLLSRISSGSLFDHYFSVVGTERPPSLPKRSVGQIGSTSLRPTIPNKSTVYTGIEILESVCSTKKRPAIRAKERKLCIAVVVAASPWR